MIPELHNFYAELTELLRANHGDNLVISMRDHQRRLVVRREPEGPYLLESPYIGTIPKAEKS